MLLADTHRQLLRLLADGQFHSGTELASALGVSRSAVWKQLQSLVELGLELNGVSGKGYKLEPALQLLDQKQICRFLTIQALQLLVSLEIHDVLDSTNNFLLERAQHGAGSGLVCLAEYQTAGKGRRGRRWVSPFGQNIYISMLWSYHEGPSAINGLSLAVGVAVVRALQQFGLEGVGLKWPNDIYCRQRKLAGILVEVSGESGGPCHAVIGLGINFVLTAEQAKLIDQPWIDIVSILGADAILRRNELIALLINQLLPVIADFAGDSIKNYLDEWRCHDCMLGKHVELSFGQQTRQGRVVGVDDDGLLLLKTGDGELLSFASGEVSLRAS